MCLRCLSPHPEDELPSPAAPKAPVLPPGVIFAGLVEEVPITAGRTGLVVVIVGVPAVVVGVSAVVVGIPAVVVGIPAVVVGIPAVVVGVTTVVIAVVAALSHGGERHRRQ